ncbi:FAD-dependent oxidoreductase [Hansschlegelia beijingensis]|uniref:2-polyprenyl-6-methoxyphenol hydroxylase-like FAD-dependent oxidoreductase n=1 Tax=Hansschlegelia beijingensis TaxID=1133344 RepID=A0A7W6GF89_9HYPH|nr:FAD-dependent oxidoreductase [Hansschlegelia beijingensis]MBB3972888.1 2-polyprenyl-6-methoxyphenol hydroxylase-like FAD-dependent oxidoreductase [Hansschlegelia beijingensis]
MSANSGPGAPRELAARCCVVGGGPAGLMLGLLLARAGVDVVVLEKHADFLRDFRGDTIHPSTLDVMADLGLLRRLLELPHQEVETLTGFVEDEAFGIADFRRLSTRCRFIALMPQWDFLDFIAGEAGRYPGFRLIRRAEATGVIRREGRVMGVEARTEEGPLTITADLVVGCDGRRSAIRQSAGLESGALGAPMDVMWFRLSRKPADGDATAGRFSAGAVFVTINRGDYWQCAYLIPKGGADAVRERGLEAFRQAVARLAPFAAERAAELVSWDQVSLLTVAVDRLKRWDRPGVLCIGDAAHAMSPIGGVGINLAIQDAVATANLLAAPLREGRLRPEDVRRVQARREWPTRVTQALQVQVQNRIITRALAGGERLRPPLALRLMRRFPALTRIPARIVGVGVRPERVTAPPVAAQTPP